MPELGARADTAADLVTGVAPAGATVRVRAAGPNGPVTVEAVDPKVPSITVVGEGGNKVTHKVKEENRKALDGVKPGDKIDISYTETMTIDVQGPTGK